MVAKKEKIIKICPICRKEFKVLPCHSDRVYCSIKCVGISNKGKLSGDNNPAKREEVRKRMSESQRKRFGLKKKRYCLDCGKELTGHSNCIRCIKCNHKYYSGIRHWTHKPEYSGKNHPSYKGGRKRDYIYSTLFNKEIKKLIFARDDYICQICGKRGGKLHCHHIDYNKFNTSLENLITLCNSCHTKTNHNRIEWMEKFNYKHKVYTAVIGRFQVPEPHEGHIKLIRTLLNEGKNVSILLRESSMDSKNPYDFYERREGMEKIFKKEILEGRVIVVPIPDIDEVIYGRNVGWKVREIRLDKETESISATKIRENMK